MSRNKKSVKQIDNIIREREGFGVTIINKETGKPLRSDANIDYFEYPYAKKAPDTMTASGFTKRLAKQLPKNLIPKVKNHNESIAHGNKKLDTIRGEHQSKNKGANGVNSKKSVPITKIDKKEP